MSMATVRGVVKINFRFFSSEPEHLGIDRWAWDEEGPGPVIFGSEGRRTKIRLAKFLWQWKTILRDLR